VKLLFDENLSHKLVAMLADVFPESTHILDIGLGGASDASIWAAAQDHGLVIVSRDQDFRDRSYLEGAPPKVIWLNVGNASTKQVAATRRNSLD